MNVEIENFITAHDKRKRREAPTGVMIHHTGVGGRKKIDDTLWQKLYKNLTNYLAAKDKNYVSCHYTIGREGEITQVVDPEKYEAWHAGRSEHWDGYHRRIRTNLNRTHIGIELIGDGNLHEYSEAQYRATARLTAYLMDRFPAIHPSNIIGHEAAAPDRKSDPGRLFDWHHFHSLLWCYVG